MTLPSSQNMSKGASLSTLNRSINQNGKSCWGCSKQHSVYGLVNIMYNSHSVYRQWVMKHK